MEKHHDSNHGSSGASGDSSLVRGFRRDHRLLSLAHRHGSGVPSSRADMVTGYRSDLHLLDPAQVFLDKQIRLDKGKPRW